MLTEAEVEIDGCMRCRVGHLLGRAAFSRKIRANAQDVYLSTRFVSLHIDKLNWALLAKPQHCNGLLFGTEHFSNQTK